MILSEIFIPKKDTSQIFRHHPIFTKNSEYSVNMERMDMTINMFFDFSKNESSLISDTLTKRRATSEQNISIQILNKYH